MKKSYYNFIYSRSKDYLIYNSFTNSLAVLSSTEYENYNNMDLDNNEINSLKYGGFIIDDNVDELSRIKYNLLSTRYSSKGLGLTIAPTMDCNFACPYCFETEHSNKFYMDEYVIGNIVSYVESKANEINSLDIGWYGGEPLLAPKIIDELSRKLIAISKKFDFEYNSYMVSNGFLLSENMSKKLKEWNVSSIQITIDGNKENHDKKRCLRDGTPTYDKILYQIEKNYKLLPKISVRINVDDKNLASEKELKIRLKEFDIDNKIDVYIARIRNENGTYEDNLCIDKDKFEDYELSAYINSAEGFINNMYPRLFYNYCTADHINSSVINYNGDVYKCWSDIGISNRKIGKLSNKGIEISNETDYLSYILFDPTEDDECKVCKFLPICMGGCPYQRKTKIKECTTFKNNIEKIIKLTAKLRCQ